MTHLNKFLAIGTAAAVAVSASTFAMAAPIGVGSGQLALQNSEVSDVIEVSRRGRRNTAIGLGVLGGIALGSALAHGHYAAPAPYYPHYYAPRPRRICLVPGPYYGQYREVYC